MSLVSINPYTGLEQGRYPQHSPAEVELRLQRAEQAFAHWKHRSFEQRAQPVLLLATLLETQREPLALLICEEMGKRLIEARAEIDKCVACCRFYSEYSESYLAPEPVRTEAHHSYIRYQPLGPILAVMPWNFPFWQVFRFLIPALMAGNTALLKHARNVTGCAQKLEQLLQEAGFPDGLFAQLQLPGASVEPVISDPRIRGVAITGSTKAGAQVAAAAGRALKPSVLELGGSDPFVVLADADLERVIPAAIAARFANAGQVCIAAKRFLVDEAIYPEFLRRFTAAAKALQLGNPQDARTDLAPMATKALRDELHDQVQQALEAGATLHCGGVLPAETDAGYFYPATVLSDVAPENPVFSQELFGPVAQVLPFSDTQQAVRLANGTPFGLGASVWSDNRVDAEALGRQLLAGAVYINSPVKSDFRLPFGGVRDSGYGREMAAAGLRSFCNQQSVWVQDVGV